jgi:hypothetical protein
MSVTKATYIAIILLVGGCAIYATCRQDIIFFRYLGSNTGLLEWMRIDIHYEQGNILTYFLLFCLPDMLWYLALLLFQKQFYNRSRTNKILFYAAASLPFVFEILQYFKVLSGTFDIMDVFFYSLIFITFIIIWKKNQVRAFCLRRFV